MAGGGVASGGLDRRYRVRGGCHGQSTGYQLLQLILVYRRAYTGLSASALGMGKYFTELVLPTI